MDIIIVTDFLSAEEIKVLAEATFGDMVKFVVDLDQEIIAIGGELHADAEAVLLKNGSQQSNVWGANLFPDRPAGQRLEYNSLINIRPNQGNRSTDITDMKVQERILDIVKKRLALF